MKAILVIILIAMVGLSSCATQHKCAAYPKSPKSLFYNPSNNI